MPGLPLKCIKISWLLVCSHFRLSVCLSCLFVYVCFVFCLFWCGLVCLLVWFGLVCFVLCCSVCCVCLSICLIVPQQRKLMGPSAQNSSGVHWCRPRVRFNEVLEKVPHVPEKVWKALVQSQVRFNRVPGKVPKKVWEALVQSQVRCNGHARIRKLKPQIRKLTGTRIRKLTDTDSETNRHGFGN